MDICTLTFAKRDEFKRKHVAERTISLFQADINVSPMVIDGSWGTGKTEFCHKLINLMAEQNTHHLIYVDAFRADHADEPLMTVLAEVIKILPDDQSKKSFIKKALPAVRFGLKTFAKAGVSHILRQDAADVVEDFDKEIQQAADKTIDAAVESVLKDHVKAEQNIKALQKALAGIAAQKPIVLFIDELDRCRPNFAIDMLEIIKHTFDVDGVSFVLVTNTQQLKASINHCYGTTVDAQRYLDKFVKFTVTLPATIDTNTHRNKVAAIEHYRNLVQKSPILTDLNLNECGSIRTIKTLISVNRLSLREIETLVRHIEIYEVVSRQSYLKPKTIFGFKILSVFSIFIYCFNPVVALSILEKKHDAKDIGKIFGISSLSERVQNQPDEQELICYMLGREALTNSNYFTPTEEDADTWKRTSQDYFRGAHWRTEDYSEICAEVIKALSMC